MLGNTFSIKRLVILRRRLLALVGFPFNFQALQIEILDAHQVGGQFLADSQNHLKNDHFPFVKTTMPNLFPIYFRDCNDQFIFSALAIMLAFIIIPPDWLRDVNEMLSHLRRTDFCDDVLNLVEIRPELSSRTGGKHTLF